MGRKPTDEIEITDAWIREELKRRKANPRGTFKPHYTCKREKGFMVWFAKDLTVTLALRLRVKRPGMEAKRMYEVLGHWVDPKEIKSDSALSVSRAKVKVVLRRAHYEENGLAVAVEIPTLGAAIDAYVIARRDHKDPRTSKRRAPLPESWDENIARFRTMFKPYVDQPVSALTYDNMLEARNAYVTKEYGTADFEKGLQRVRCVFTTTIPMLKWFRDAKGYMPHAGMIEALTPDPYAKNTRFLYPGEWQKSLPIIDAFPDASGLFLRFILATGARSETVLGMKWDEIDLGVPDRFKDADGREHDCVVWIVPRNEKGRMKGRGVDDELERRILLCGESLRIVRIMRKRFEEAKENGATGVHVWPQDVRARWRNRRSKVQREVEATVGTTRWNRYTLRKTHATYLEYLNCPKHLISVSLVHTAPQDGAAAVTSEHYTFADAARELQGKDDPLYQLGPWLLKLHKLVKDIEDGNPSPELKAIQHTMRVGKKSADMRDRYGIAKAFIDIEERAPRLVAVK